MAGITGPAVFVAVVIFIEVAVASSGSAVQMFPVHGVQVLFCGILRASDVTLAIVDIEGVKADGNADKMFSCAADRT